MDCVDELLFQASHYPWQMAEILSGSLALICKESVKLGFKLKHLPLFLNSRLLPPQPFGGFEPPYPSNTQGLKHQIIMGFDSSSLPLEQYISFFGLSAGSLSNTTGGSKGKAAAHVLYLPNVVHLISTMKKMHGISARSMDTATIQCEAWEAITEYTWMHVYRSLFFVQFLSYVCYMAICFPCLMSFRISGLDRDPSAKWVHGILVLCFNCGMLCNEVVQMYTDGWNSTKWHYFQSLNYCLYICFIVLDAFANGDDPSSHSHLKFVASVASLTSIVMSLYYARGFLSLSVVIRILIKMFLSLRYLLLIFSVVMLAFMMAFWMLTEFSGSGSNRDEEQLMNFLSIVEMCFTLGLVAEDRVEAIASFMKNADVKLQIAFWCLYFSYIFSTAIVMLNLMIAIMNNEYEEIVRYSLIEAKRERFALMDDLNSHFLAKVVNLAKCRRRCGWKDAKTNPRYIFVYSDRVQALARGRGHSKKSGLGEGGVHDEPRSTDYRQPAEGGPGTDLDVRISALMVSHFAEVGQMLAETFMTSKAKSEELIRI